MKKSVKFACKRCKTELHGLFLSALSVAILAKKRIALNHLSHAQTG